MIDIFTDIHRYAPHSIFPELKEKFNELIHLNTTFCLGDYVDMKNVLNDELGNAHECMKATESIMFHRYIKGNHELDPSAPPFTIMELKDGRKCLFTHGDYPLWSTEYAKKWRSKKPSSSVIKRMITLVWAYLREMFLNPDELYIEDLLALEKYASARDCQVIVIGHLHPRKLIQTHSGEVEIFVCPRGHTRLPLDLA